MPHDAIGREIIQGDIVMVPFKVKRVHPMPEGCNVDLESVQGMPGSGHPSTFHAINTRQTLRHNRTDKYEFAVAEEDGRTRIDAKLR